MTEYFETRIENLEKSITSIIQSRNNSKIKKGSKERKLVSFDDSDDRNSDEGHSGKRFYQFHDTCIHTTDQYTTLNQGTGQASKIKKSKHFDKKKRFTKPEVNAMGQKKVKNRIKEVY